MVFGLIVAYKGLGTLIHIPFLFFLSSLFHAYTEKKVSD